MPVLWGMLSRFGGDTSVALGQVAYSPTDLTKFNFIVPCMDPNAVEDLGTFSRFAASTAITVVNATITQKAPIVFTLLRAPQGVCNPFGPAPNYTFYEGTCKDICPPYEQFCKGRTIDITTLADVSPPPPSPAQPHQTRTHTIFLCGGCAVQPGCLCLTWVGLPSPPLRSYPTATMWGPMERTRSGLLVDALRKKGLQSLGFCRFRVQALCS